VDVENLRCGDERAHLVAKDRSCDGRDALARPIAQKGKLLQAMQRAQSTDETVKQLFAVARETR
jgi:hypothetical protein